MSNPQEIKALGNEKFKEGQYELAATLYSQAIDASPSPDAILYSNRSNAYFQMGEFNTAKDDAIKATQIDPNYFKSYWRLAEISRCTAHQQEAYDYYMKAHTLKPDSKQIAEQVKNMINIISASKKPKVNFFDAIKDIPCRSFIDPNQQQQQPGPYGQPQPYMNPSMFSNPFGTTGTAPDTVDEKGRDFSVPEDIVKLSASEKQQFITSLYNYLIKPQHLNTENLIKLMRQTGLLLSQTPIVQRSSLKENQNMYIIGDIHGSLPDLKSIFGDKISLHKFSQSSDLITILGDYVDRGNFGHQVITLATALKICFPDRVTILRGNHETMQLNNFFGYQSQVENAYGSKSSVFQVMTNLFAELPLVHIFTDEKLQLNYFCCHGGPPIQSDIQNFNDLCNLNIQKAIEPQDPLSQQLMWSDPNHEGGQGMTPSHRGVGFIYGNQVFEEFRVKCNIHRLFRAHEVVFDPMGVRDDFNTERHFTIFSSSQYMSQNNTGGMVRLIGGVDEVRKIKLM